MAEAGLRRSFTRGSEEVLDTNCDICLKDGRNTDASSHCVDCNAHVCVDCTRWHAKFPATKGHKVVDIATGKQMDYKVAIEKGQRSGVAIPPLPKRPISDRPPPPLPKNNRHGVSESQSLPGKLRSHPTFELKEKLEKIRLSKLEQLKQVDIAEKGNVNSVQLLLNKLLKGIDDLGAVELENIARVHDADRKALQNEIQQIDAYMNTCVTDKNVTSQRGQEILSQVSRETVGNKKFMVDCELENYVVQLKSLGNFAGLDTGRSRTGRLENSRSFDVSRLDGGRLDGGRLDGGRLDTGRLDTGRLDTGRLDTGRRLDTGHVLEFLRDYDIAFRGDRSVCKAYGSCLLADGSVVFADNENTRLKLLNRTNGRCYAVDLPCGPWGVCSTDHFEVAVTLTNEKRVQFVSVGSTMGMTKSFSVDQFCRGICHIQGDLYVACGSLNHAGSAFVGVYTMSGRPLRKIQPMSRTGSPLFSLPHHVTICDNGRMCVADKTQGVVVMEQNGTVSRFSDEKLTKPFGICTLGNGDILVCCLNSDTIVQFSGSGRKLKTLLGPADGLYGPYSLLVDQANSTLIVTTYESNRVKEYAIK